MTAKQKAQNLFNEVHPYIKEDLFEALMWAREELTNKEGSGHQISLIATKDQKFECCFAKPQWNADHCGQAMYEAPEAIVMAVCEYFSGV